MHYNTASRRHRKRFQECNLLFIIPSKTSNPNALKSKKFTIQLEKLPKLALSLTSQINACLCQLRPLNDCFLGSLGNPCNFQMPGYESACVFLIYRVRASLKSLCTLVRADVGRTSARTPDAKVKPTHAEKRVLTNYISAPVAGIPMRLHFLRASKVALGVYFPSLTVGWPTCAVCSRILERRKGSLQARGTSARVSPSQRLVHTPGQNPDVDQAETSRSAPPPTMNGQGMDKDIAPAQLRDLEHRLCKPPAFLYMAWPSPAWPYKRVCAQGVS